MRLRDSERAAIKSTILNLDPQAKIYLFGSRVDDAKKGGDIDLLVISRKPDRDRIRAAKARLYELIGEQKIDIVLAVDDTDPFVKLALTTGVEL